MLVMIGLIIAILNYYMKLYGFRRKADTLEGTFVTYCAYHTSNRVHKSTFFEMLKICMHTDVLRHTIYANIKPTLHNHSLNALNSKKEMLI